MTNILKEEHNCWKISHARRFSVLVDAGSYFSALYSSLLQARHCTLLCGWDFHSRTALLRDENDPIESSRLRKVLDRAAKQSPDLQTYVLAWDYAMLYALEREPLSVFNFAWRSHSRVHFTMDGQHPIGASHHQKIAALDDCIGYTGGVDITQRRWDMPEHKIKDPRRTDPSGSKYAPFHDLQAVVEGEPAYWLAQFIRQRWHSATGKEVAPPPPDMESIDWKQSPWPEDVAADLTDVKVAVARTMPRFKQRSSVKEIEQLYLDAIASSKKTIYIENQYLAAQKVVDALATRLAGDAPPEVVILLPLHCTGWLEEQVMDSLRIHAYKTLREADKHDRCRLFHPAADPAGEHPIKVHSKCMIVDDAFITLGSANLSNRSMGLDTECNLAVETKKATSQKGIANIRERLLADHLGADQAHVRAAMAEHGSLLQLIDADHGGGNSLVPLEKHLETTSNDIPIDMVRSLDPEDPVTLDTFLDQIIETPQFLKQGKVQLTFATLIILGIGALAFWRLSPWGGADMVFFLDQTAMHLREWSLAPYLVIGAYALAGILPLPLVLLTAITTLIYAPAPCFLYIAIGTLLGASLGYITGHFLGKKTIRRIVGSGLNNLSRHLARGGFIPVLLSRLVPLMPFNMVNLVAGASRVHYWQFILGTAAGLAPVLVAFCVIVEGLREMLLAPSWLTTTFLLGSGSAILFALSLLKRRLEPYKPDAAMQKEDSE